MKTVFTRIAAVAAIASLATPAFAEPIRSNPASKLSVASKVRTGTKTNKAGGIAPVVINIAILAALTGGVLLATTGGNSDSN